MTKRTVKPGAPVPASGIWKSPGRRATLDRGETAPPTKRPGEKWKLVPGTKTNPGGGR
jgi:hypothetical protein